MHDFPRAHQVRRIRRVTCQFQRKIRLAGRIELGRTTGIDAPAAVRQLALADVVGQLGDALRISLAKNVEVIDVIRFQCGIGFEFTLPVALLGLKRKEVVRAALNRFFEPLSPVLLLPRDRRRSGNRLLSYAGK